MAHVTRKPRSSCSPAGSGTRSRRQASGRRQSVRSGDRALCEQATQCLVAQAVAGLAIGLVLIDPRGRVVWLNRTAERVLGTPAAACAGRPLARLLRDPQLAAFWHEAGCRTGDCLGEVTVRWPQALELKLNVTRCLDTAGQEIGRALLFCDVTADRSVQITLTKEVADRLLGLAEQSAASLHESLTAQELRILRLVGRGRSNDAIAAEISVAGSTVRSHLKNIYRKLSVRTRAEAVRFAVESRLT